MADTGAVPCPGSWEPLWCCPKPDPAQYPGVDIPALIAQSVAAAAEVLYNLTGQRFGLCELTLRPCRRDCWGNAWPWGGTWWEWTGQTMWPRPALIDGSWFNLTCGGCPSGCSCTPLSETLLPGPVDKVVQVKEDGKVLVPGVDYRLDNMRSLVRLGGRSWPLCQRLDRDDDQPGTWSVTAEYGEQLPVSGKLALGELACAFMDACLGNDCPPALRPVQQLTRQGVTLTFLDPNQVFAQGRTGLTQVDLFVQWANPKRLLSAPQVFDVDSPPPRRVDT